MKTEFVIYKDIPNLGFIGFESFELGRQNGIYLKSKVSEIDDAIFDHIPEFFLYPKERDLVDLYFVRFQQGNIPEHSDIVEGYKYHYRYNISLNRECGYHIGKSSVIVPKNSAILFRSDLPHEAFIDIGPVDILSFGLVTNDELVFDAKFAEPFPMCNDHANYFERKGLA